jgi:hypothetical protein
MSSGGGTFGPRNASIHTATEGATLMSSSPPTVRPKRTRTSAKRTSETDRTERAQSSIRTVTAEQRRMMIAESAYRRAERRGFSSGHAIADWLESEREVDALLSRSAD